jgi:hypothetical protein
MLRRRRERQSGERERAEKMLLDEDQNGGVSSEREHLPAQLLRFLLLRLPQGGPYLERTRD